MKKFSKKNVNIFFSSIFFHGCGASPPRAPPTGLHPWSSFGLRTLCSGNRFALNAISAKNLNIIFIEIFFFNLKKKKFLKSSESYPKKMSSKSDEIFFFGHIFHFFHISNRHISKTKNRKIVFEIWSIRNVKKVAKIFFMSDFDENYFGYDSDDFKIFFF